MRMLGSASVRVLDDRYREEALSILDADSIANVFVASRVHAVGLDQARLGAQMWGYLDDGRLRSLCYSGANLVPVSATPEAVRAFAERARAQGRRCSSIVGPIDAVAQLWEILEPYWGPPRAVRHVQPVMAISSLPAATPDPAVRRVGVGEVGAVTPYACQVQGVWVTPELRGNGIAVHGMAALVEEALRTIAPTVTLYVNDYNAPARAAYRHVGFKHVDTFMSVLF